MNILVSLIVGLVVGLIAGAIMKSGGGLLRNIICGLLGGVVGGWLSGVLGISFSPAWLCSGIFAIIGACLVIWIARLITGKK